MTTTIKALLVHPKFNANSFWNYKAACELVDAKYPASPLGLITVAALLPDHWSARLIDRNCEELTDDDIACADIVMIGAMLPQQLDALQTAKRAQALGKKVVMGGPDVTSSPDCYEIADFLVLGEAEEILSDFTQAFERGDERGRFRAELFKVDVTKSPLPRFDLLKKANYLHIGVQYSRGCPFTCEFCDIIELYGRKPRMKTNAQMLAELDLLYDSGYRGHVDFVDDNLIGNKKAVKLFLPDLIAWQKKHGFPFEFSTEASINLSDDPVLLDLMSQAGFFAVFVGIESSDEETLAAARKKQNTRRSIPESIDDIYKAGIAVVAGFIVGFDTEKGSVYGPTTELISDTKIAVSMAGLLYALNNTQLSRRLEKEQRLYSESHIMLEDATDAGVGDQCTAGLNFDTLRPRRDILQDYRDIIATIYAQEHFVDRVKRMGESLVFNHPHPHPLNLGVMRKDLVQFAKLAWRISTKRPDVCGPFWSLIWHFMRKNPRSLKIVVLFMTLYTHLGRFSSYVVEEIDRQIAVLDHNAALGDAALSERELMHRHFDGAKVGAQGAIQVAAQVAAE